ncbi:MAG: DUF692 family protein [Candidatus Thiodiazotropha sp. (ex Dulcina madagascariensis)]|nr:DUF692 family protein [Candidatus Thiodiazotropha sp. (ex Dulcina madagascariensis)]
MDINVRNSNQHTVSIGAGYNSCYILKDSCKKLALPETVTHLELGLPELPRWLSRSGMTSINLSLHLARTPITESKESQDKFINYLTEKIYDYSNIDHHRMLVSIGVHLTGRRDEGIGRYGFSSHYNPTLLNERHAERFVKKLQDRVGLPIWIENANFYSHSIESIFHAWKSTERICRETGSYLIIDISHLAIDALNSGIDPLVILGSIPWDLVVEIHISGIIKGPDGAYHDGHSVKVHDIVWKLFGESMRCLNLTGRPTIATIEHTDPNWFKKRQEHDEDFNKLREHIDSSLHTQSKAGYAEVYAKSYLRKLLDQWIPNLSLACEQRQIAYDDLVSEWIDQITDKQNHRIVLTEDEALNHERSLVHLAAPSFLEFAKKRIKSCT